MTTEVTNKPTLNVAVREMAEKAKRKGPLLGNLYAGITGIEGTRIHRDFFDGADLFYPDHELFSELTLESTIDNDNLPFTLTIRGRSDLITVSPKGQIRVVEVKGFRGHPDSIPEEGDPAHIAQALIYAWLIKSNPLMRERPIDLTFIELEIRYIALDDQKTKSIVKRYTTDEIDKAFKSILNAYTKLITPLVCHRLERDPSNHKAAFPYEKLRDGQREMMQEVIASIRDKTVLFVQAPTGIGKTMGTLYPAVKAQANHLTDRIFYLTPTRSQRKIAEDTLEDLESEGFKIRSLTLNAKEQMCLSPEHFCDMTRCPYALSFYDHLNEATEESYDTRRLLPETLIALSKKHRLCPFEFALSLMPTTDVVICDYNYVFNPRVRFQNTLDDPEHRYTLLVDEAHNLARRAREMFSGVLTKSTLVKLHGGLTGARAFFMRDRASFKKTINTLERLIRTLDRYGELLDIEDDTLLENELFKALQPYQPVKREAFLATKTTPENILGDVTALSGLMTRLLMDYPEFSGRQALMLPYFDLLFFQRVSERYYDEAYITTWRKSDQGEIFVTQLALDASRHLTDLYYNRSPVVFFSATLSPLPYYTNLLDAHAAMDKPEIVQLKSPFPDERRLVICYEAHSLRYQDRSRSYGAIARFILEMARTRKGNTLVFSPSFSYQRQLVRSLAELDAKDIDFVVQPAKMTEAQKNKFLGYFQKKHHDKSLVGLTVIGSLLNEGIDLVGQELTGVVVIGTGIPGLSPERDILRQYYDGKTGQGFQYAYTWPGFNRVTQAVGRLIRSEEDFGYVILIDDRYGRPDYMALIPEEWHATHTDSSEECLELLQSFWKNFD